MAAAKPTMAMKNDETRQLRAWSVEAALGFHASKRTRDEWHGVTVAQVLKDAKLIEDYVRAANQAAPGVGPTPA